MWVLRSSEYVFNVVIASSSGNYWVTVTGKSDLIVVVCHGIEVGSVQRILRVENLTVRDGNKRIQWQGPHPPQDQAQGRNLLPSVLNPCALYTNGVGWKEGMELCWKWNCWDAWDPSLCILLMHLGCTLPALRMNVVSTKWKHIMIIARRIPRMSHHCDPHHPSFKPHAIPLGVMEAKMAPFFAISRSVRLFSIERNGEYNISSYWH